MKRAVFLILPIALTACFLALAGCTPVNLPGGDPGKTVTKEFAITDFDRIEVDSSFKVEISPSDNYSVAITAGENIFEYLDLYRAGSTLKIGLKGLRWDFGRLVLEARVKLPALRGVELTGATEGRAGAFISSEDTEIELSGASQLELDLETAGFRGDISGASQLTGHLVASSSEIKISGASRAAISGSSTQATFKISGASRGELRNFEVTEADIDLSGASTASLYITGHFDADISGASRLEYTGDPTIGEINITGASSLRHK